MSPIISAQSFSHPNHHFLAGSQRHLSIHYHKVQTISLPVFGDDLNHLNLEYVHFLLSVWSQLIYWIFKIKIKTPQTWANAFSKFELYFFYYDKNFSSRLWKKEDNSDFCYDKMLKILYNISIDHWWSRFNLFWNIFI